MTLWVMAKKKVTVISWKAKLIKGFPWPPRDVLLHLSLICFSTGASTNTTKMILSPGQDPHVDDVVAQVIIFAFFFFFG